jgi:NAD(P)-dependent dehydrogenase (short-subunit alcohol dehydrogenase family)
MEIAGTSAIVTGAASGLGGATAAALARSGVTVIGVDLAAGWERVGQPNDDVTAVAGDVTDADDVGRAIDAAVASGAPLRMAVNCAGVGWASRILSKKGVHDYDLFRTVVGINLIGTFNVLRLAAAAIAETDPVDDAGQRGLIINTASVAAFDGQIGQIAYAASKGGVAAMTLPAARDLASRGVRVMTIAFMGACRGKKQENSTADEEDGRR